MSEPSATRRRPGPKNPKGLTETVAFQISPPDLEALDRVAELKGVFRSEYVRTALMAAVHADLKKNPKKGG